MNQCMEVVDKVVIDDPSINFVLTFNNRVLMIEVRRDHPIPDLGGSKLLFTKWGVIGKRKEAILKAALEATTQ